MIWRSITPFSDTHTMALLISKYILITSPWFAFKNLIFPRDIQGQGRFGDFCGFVSPQLRHFVWTINHRLFTSQGETAQWFMFVASVSPHQYPLVNCHITNWKISIFNGDSSTISTGPWLQVRKLLVITRGYNHHQSLLATINHY